MPWYKLFFLVILTFLTVWAWWTKQPVCGAAGMIMLILTIEHFIHTTYTLTNDGYLVIEQGRFSRKHIIPLKEIHDIEHHQSAGFGRFHLNEYLIIRYGKDRTLSLIPEKEEEFIHEMNRRIRS